MFFLCSFPLFSSSSLSVIIIFFILVSVKISLCIWTFDHEVSKFLCFDDNNAYCRVNYSYILPFEFLVFFEFLSEKACGIASKFPLTKFSWNNDIAFLRYEGFCLDFVAATCSGFLSWIFDGICTNFKNIEHIKTYFYILTIKF